MRNLITCKIHKNEGFSYERDSIDITSPTGKTISIYRKHNLYSYKDNVSVSLQNKIRNSKIYGEILLSIDEMKQVMKIAKIK